MDYKEKVIALLNSHELSNEQKEKLESIFPELKESEDERIRKALIRAFERIDILVWLEKQSKASKVEESMREVEEKAKAFTETHKGETSEEILAQMKGEQKPAWSEEDENGLGDALWCIKQASRIAKDENEMGNCWYAENWLKSLKERMQPHPKQEWSEEDECNMRRIIRVLEDNDSDWNELTAWLKSLKPQNIWKPSDEQMKVIEYICDGNYKVDLDILDSIYRDFKKLRKE